MAKVMIPAMKRLESDKPVLEEAPPPSDAVVGLTSANSELPVKSGLSTVARASEKVGLPCSSVVLMVEVVTIKNGSASITEFVSFGFLYKTF